jgi:hypothetical protein
MVPGDISAVSPAACGHIGHPLYANRAMSYVLITAIKKSLLDSHSWPVFPCVS